MEEKWSVDAALEAALDALSAGDVETARRIAETHPDAPELRELLTAATEIKQALAVSPSPLARARHMRMLRDAVDRLHERRGVGLAARMGHLRVRVLRPIAVLSAAVLLAMPATVALASDAQPGAPLYGTKLAIEKVQLALELDPEGDVELHQRFAERRLQELSNMGPAPSGEAATLALSNLSSHAQAVNEGVEGRPNAGAKVETRLQKQVETLRGLITNTGCNEPESSKRVPGCDGLIITFHSSTEALAKIEEDNEGGGAVAAPAETPSASASPTASKSASPGTSPDSGSARVTVEPSPSRGPSDGPSASASPNASESPSPTESSCPSPSSSPTQSPTPTATPSETQSASPGSTGVESSCPSPSPSPTGGSSSGSSPSPSPSPGPSENPSSSATVPVGS